MTTPSFELRGGYRLRPLQESDALELHALIDANRAHLARWMPWAASQTEADTIQFIRATRRQLAENDGFQAAVLSAELIVGVAGYHSVDWPNRATSIGYWLAADAQGRGTMTEAVTALVDHAFGTWKLNRVEIRIDVANRSSRAIPERLGFWREGTLRQAQRPGERYSDQVVYAVLAGDWISPAGAVDHEPPSA
ncbi:MAG TPA: GNAT family protein [Solirubrobacteraceae bacterium]|jgi:ribosomal-protein-serine acetyltransferase